MPAALLVTGIACGLGAAIPIGPVNVEIARRSLRSGFRAGAAIGLGAVTVDVAYSCLYAIGAQNVATLPAIYWTLAVVGIALLIYLGVSSLWEAWKGSENSRLETPSKPVLLGGYGTGLLMTATNPMTLAFWFSVLPALAGRISEHPRRDLPIICLGVFLGAMTWVLFFSGLLGLAGRFRRPWWLRVADAVGGAMLLGLAVVAIVRAFPGFKGS